MKGKIGLISIGLVLLAALLMIIPATAVQSTAINTNTEQSAVPFEYVQVPIKGPDTVAQLRAQGLEVVDDSGWAAIVKMPLDMKAAMKGKVNFIEMPRAKEINFLEQGYRFDVTKGVDIPAKWKSTGSDEYVIQFIAPARDKWLKEIGSIAPIQRHVGDNAVVMKLTPEQKAKIAALPYVQWTGTYEPAFKVYKDLREKSGDVRVKAFAYKGADLQDLAKSLVNLGAKDILVRDDWENSVSFVIDAAKLPDVAKLDSVMLLKENPQMTTYSQKAGEISRVHVVWDTAKSNLPQAITGKDEVIHIQDTRLDTTHWDFTKGPLGNRIVYAESSTDSSDHGTYCTGIAAGNGYDMEGWLGLNNTNHNYYELASSNPLGQPDLAGFAGKAPEVNISFGAGLSSTDWPTGYSNGARIFSNSWGPATVTPGYDSTADSFMVNNPDALIFFGLGNDGPNEITAGGAGNGKMVVAMEASENHRPYLFDDSDDPNQLIRTSARGPVSSTDLRVKPDLIEVGGSVYSTKGDWTSTDASTIYQGSDTDSSLLVDYDGDGVGDYECYSGSSLAAPAGAGDAILVRDWLEDVEGVSDPEPMLIKALLINGATDMGYGFPSYDQGWGHVNIENTIAPPAPRTNKYWVANTTGTWSQTVNVVKDNVPLKVTMAQRDTDTTSGALTVDYDLTVTAPDGTVYQGNLFNNSVSVGGDGSASQWENASFPPQGRQDGTYGVANTNYDWDTANDGGDDINTVEEVIVPNPAAGDWTITVTLKSGTAVNFAVVAAANFGPKTNVDYEVELTSDYNRTYPLVDGGGESTHTVAPGGSFVYGFTVYNNGPNADQIALSASLPTGWSVSFTPASPLAINSGEGQHVLAMITAPSTAENGTYTIKITGTSNNDVTAPIAQDYLLLSADVVVQKIPKVDQLTTSTLHDDAPQIATYTSGTTDYVIVAYRHDTGMGNRVYVKVSSDGGQTFGAPIKVSSSADGPSFLGLAIKNVGTNYLGRAFITWNAYKPAVAGDDTASTTGDRVMLAYADPSSGYTSWTQVTAFSNGEGLSTTANANGYRSIFTAFYGDEVHVIVECFEYDNQDLTVANLIGIDAAEKVSNDGGDTWGDVTAVSPQDGNYYFFPSGYTNEVTGDIVVWYYWRTPTGTDRDLLYQIYNGSWGSGINSWDTNDNIMFPYGTFDPSTGRDYSSVCRGATADSDKNLYVVYTDDEGTSFTTGLGPFGPVIDDADYGSRYVLDMDSTSDGYIWTTYSRSPSGDPYLQPNMYTVRSNDGFTTTTEDLLTADSYTKGKSRAAASGNNLLMTYYSNSRAGNMDLWKTTVNNTWTSAADTDGPETQDANADLLYCPQGANLTVAANINDWARGGSNIATAEYFIDSIGVDGDGTHMNAIDGIYDNPEEGVSAGIDTSSLSPGNHTIYIHGQDAAGNWGEFDSVTVEIYFVADYPNFAGLESVSNAGDGSSLVLHWSAAEDLQGDYPITYNIYRATTSGGEDYGTPTATYTPTGVNPGDPISWTDTGLTQGTTYYYVVRAQDSNGNEDSNTVEKSGTPSIKWYLQIESSAISGYKNLTDLTVDPLDTGATETTGDITDAGQYQIGTGWMTEPMDSDVDVAGNWTFNMYGYLTAPYANGTLYAKVYRYNNGTPVLLFQTPDDDEDVGSYTSSHMFTWTYNAPSANVPAGDRIYVEIWLNVSSVSSTGITKYDYSGVIQNGTQDAYYCDVDIYPPEGANLNSKEELNNSEYSEISSSDDIWYVSPNPGVGDKVFMWFDMKVNESTANITQINFSFEGHPASAGTLYIYLYNASSAAWEVNELAADSFSTADSTLKGILTERFGDYINSSGYIRWGVYSEVSNASLYVDYVSMDIVCQTNSEFLMQYDSPDTPSSIIPALHSWAPSMNITTHSGYNLITLPWQTTPVDIETALSDISWDKAAVYINNTWYTYSKARPAKYNLGFPAVDNKMGIWVNCTADGTLSGPDQNIGNTTIPLHKGWNLVGYPSNTDRKVSDALSGIPWLYVETADTFGDVYSLSSSDYMTVGNGYWIYVTADCTWTVAW